LRGALRLFHNKLNLPFPEGVVNESVNIRGTLDAELVTHHAAHQYLEPAEFLENVKLLTKTPIRWGGAAGANQFANPQIGHYVCPMTSTVEAIYQHGKLVLPRPLSLPENSYMLVTIESDPEREAWLKLSETSLTQYWTNDADDVFNELLQK